MSRLRAGTTMAKSSDDADDAQSPNTPGAANVMSLPDAEARQAEFATALCRLIDAGFEKRSPADYAALLKAAAKLRDISVDAVRAEVRQRRRPGTESKPKPVAATAGDVVAVVDGLALADELQATINRHLRLPPFGAVVILLWILHTHAFYAARHTPRLALIAHFENSGKTTVLKLLNKLCFKPHLTSNATIAAIFRLIDAAARTMLLDEADTYLDGPEFSGLINSGHDREGAKYDRCEKNAHGEFSVATFNTYAPLAMARIGGIEPASTRSRCIVINMQRARPDEQPLPLVKTSAETWHRLQAQCGRWASQNDATLREAEPDTTGLDNRAADNWRPLFAIADAVGGPWPGLARQAASAFAEARKLSPAEELLVAVQRAFAGSSSDVLTAVELCQALAEDEDFDAAAGFTGLKETRAAGRALNRHFEPFGVKSVQWKVAGTRDNVRGFRREQFNDVFERFLTPTCGRGR